MKTVHQTPDGASPFKFAPRKLLYGYVLLSSLFFFIYSMYTPFQNWDMLGYAASVVSWQSEDPVYLHNFVYQELADYASNEDFKELTAGHSYRETMYKDYEAFSQQIPYYKIRLMYIGIIYVLVNLGVGLFTASHIVSAAAAALGFIAFFYAYKCIVKPILWILSPFLYVLCGVLDAGQMVTADSLAFLWLGLICCAFIKNHWVVFPLLVASTLIRADLAVFVMLVLTYYFFYRSELRLQCWLTAIATGIVCVVAAYLVGSHGWSTVFHFVFVSKMSATHPEIFSNLELSARQYFSAFANNLHLILFANEFRLFVVNVLLQTILFSHLYNATSSQRKSLTILTNNPVIALTIISCAYVVLHYFLFPAIWSRFFIAQYMVAALGVLFTLTCLMEKCQSAQNESKF